MMFLLATLAFAAPPPSSTLTGPGGTLKWEITTEGSEVHVHGESPKWQVEHVASADLTPVRTVRTNPDGTVVTIEYGASEAIVTMPNKTLTHTQPGLWDGDTLDVRLGAEAAAGRFEQKFQAVDTGSGKVYKFDSQKVGDEQCGERACTHVLVQLTGMLRWVGPSFHYWFAKDGKLLKFEGPAGEFEAG